MADSQLKQCQWNIRSSQYLGEISALCFLHLPSHLSSFPFLLAGTGSQVLLYDLESSMMIKSFQVFEGIRVHGLICSLLDNTTLACKVVVCGEKRVKLFNLTFGLVSKSNTQSEFCVDLCLIHSLPRFTHWVLDVLFLKDHCLAIGCSDNSVHVWDMLNSSLVLQVPSPDRCLLYSMRLWGDNLEALRIASGTIYNEIIVWKVICQHDSPTSTSSVKGCINLSSSDSNFAKCYDQQYKAVHICRLVGHEGSIFRIVWSSNGVKLVSVSDDRSARIWTIHDHDDGREIVGPVLFGHSARIWDCCISDHLIVTAGEDCTCRVWGLDGKQLRMIKEHIGRGIWRCLYDPNSSLLVTAGFDSAIKVHRLHTSVCKTLDLEGDADSEDIIEGAQISTTCIPNSMEHAGLMDSKSEYVRSLYFKCEDTIYVATNHGYLYHALLSETGDVKWTELVRVNGEVPIVCMDLLSASLSRNHCGIDDWVAVGDGKGNMTVVGITGNPSSPKVAFTFAWPAGAERQLLGTYWCKSLGCRYVFATDPRGVLKLWRLYDPSISVCQDSQRISLIAEFPSSFGIRIMCLDASFEEEVLVCGDLRGNLILFPLSKDLLLCTAGTLGVKISPLSYFKGAHGISTVSNISVSRLSHGQVEIRTTGADGCICYLEYDKDQESFEFIGMKQLKELSLIESVSADFKSADDLANRNYAAGFASTDFIIWNLITEAKVLQIPCGGWRRPHSYYLGDVPEMRNCFAYVKDEIIYIHRHWLPGGGKTKFPRNLHLQFHGREMHSLCFVSENSQVQGNEEENLVDKSSWIATGCEDGTVRLTRFAPEMENWSASKLLGEHVGGSAVRSICFVSNTHIIPSDVSSTPGLEKGQNDTSDGKQNPCLLVSVGAKRVLTTWLLRNRSLNEEEEIYPEQKLNRRETGCKPTVKQCSSMSFRWLSTNMPIRSPSMEGREKTVSAANKISSLDSDAKTGSTFIEKEGTKSTCLVNKYEDDWRYLAVTAFLVKCASSRLTVCFVVVACSDATLTLQALVLPHRLFDVAILASMPSPVLALQHAVVPFCNLTQISSTYLVISGATDGSIAFWDITESVETFVQRVSSLNIEKFIDCQKRPRTGRGSQGGRQWRSLNSSMSKRRFGGDSVTRKAGDVDNSDSNITPDTSSELNDLQKRSKNCSQAEHDTLLEPETSRTDSLAEICEIQPIRVMNNVHQSGVNCLHVSGDFQGSENYYLLNIVSGGDDQAVHCLQLKLTLSLTELDAKVVTSETIRSTIQSESIENIVDCNNKNQAPNHIRFLNQYRIPSAHSSAIKGIWTDGTWVFSTGLDQRIRCWLVGEHGELTEHALLIISIPEPEALDARACGRNHYQIAVSGRGMQMVEFFLP
ncbi:putative WD repeat-containing protein isoform X1 [Gossypium australe]|uniref:Putative WD repeat-containing protein isoform X1 n=1 Tax=Gossypium australe TaxID=47621 RepID=A0A5B6UYY5_9ROSI|nr:putative WD repeat-containing protein isoform X1 [Gossypium australe]